MMSVKNYCPNCGVPIANEAANYCSSCGAKLSQEIQIDKPVAGEATLITLCTLTILGSIIGVLKGTYMETFYNHELWSVWREHSSSWGVAWDIMLNYLSIICNIGTLVSAIFMLMRKKIGYKLYMAFQCIDVLSIILWLFTNTWLGSTTFSLLSAFTITLPTIVFMVLYSVLVKKLLH